LHPSCLVLTSAAGPYRASLSVHPTGRFSGSWINLLPAPSQGLHQPQWPSAGFVPNYSGGTATVLHRLPSSPMGPVSFFILFLLDLGVKGNHRVRPPGPGRTRRRLSPPPGPGPRGGGHLAWRRNQTRPERARRPLQERPNELVAHRDLMRLIGGCGKRKAARRPVLRKANLSQLNFWDIFL
jgi:hypothetical protein